MVFLWQVVSDQKPGWGDSITDKHVYQWSRTYMYLREQAAILNSDRSCGQIVQGVGVSDPVLSVLLFIICKTKIIQFSHGFYFHSLMHVLYHLIVCSRLYITFIFLPIGPSRQELNCPYRQIQNSPFASKRIEIASL